MAKQSSEIASTGWGHLSRDFSAVNQVICGNRYQSFDSGFLRKNSRSGAIKKPAEAGFKC